MKLELKSKACVIVTRNAKEYNANGNKGVAYVLGVVCDGQVAELPCSQVAYDEAGALGQYSEVVLTGEFDTNYKNFKVMIVSPVSKK